MKEVFNNSSYFPLDAKRIKMFIGLLTKNFC